EDLAGQCAEGLRPGVDGWLDDDLAFVRPWGFSVEEITAPVFVRQGEQDLMVPPAHGEWLARNIPHAVLHLEPDQGHLSFIARPDAMIEELVSVFCTPDAPGSGSPTEVRPARGGVCAP